MKLGKGFLYEIYYIHYILLIKAKLSSNQSTKLSGAAEARRAHNPEDTGSKPVSAISFCPQNNIFALFHKPVTRVSGLITVLFSMYCSCALCLAHFCFYKTVMYEFPILLRFLPYMLMCYRF